MVTKPIPVITRWERFSRQTVWHPLNTDPHDEDRAGPRFWYPVYNILVFSLGVTALLIGSPLLNKLFPVWFTDSLGVGLMLSALGCFIGVVFPKLSVLELLGKLSIVFMLGGYAGTVALFSNREEPNGFVVLVLTMAIWLLGPRITKLFIQVSRVRKERKINRGM